MKAQGLETALSATKCEKISLTATVSLKILDSSIEMGVGGNRFFCNTCSLDDRKFICLSIWEGITSVYYPVVQVS